MILKVTAENGAEVLEPGIYPVELRAVEPVEGRFGDQLCFRLSVVGHDGKPLTAWANLSTHISSKAIRWAGAFRGEPFRAGEAVDFEALRGRRAQAVVVVKELSDGRAINRVTDILPLRRVGAPTPARWGWSEEDPFAE